MNEITQTMPAEAHATPVTPRRSRAATVQAAVAGTPGQVAEAVAPYRVKHLHFMSLLDCDAAERISLAREGVSAAWLGELATRMGIPQERVFAYLGIARSTAIRKIQQDKPLATDEGERVLGLSRLIGLAEKIVRESGEPTGFDAARWTAGWLEQALPALGGENPGQFMDTATGQHLVAGLLAQMQSGAYA